MDFERIYRLYFKDVFLYLRALSASADTAEEIGFFFSSGGYQFTEGYLRIMAFDGDTVIGGRDFLLSEIW